MKSISHTVSRAEQGTRIDKLVSDAFEEITRMQAQRLIEEKHVLVNKMTCKASYKVKENDVITIEITQPEEISLQAEQIPLNIIYEDDDILVINKEKGMVVHPGNGNYEGTLVNAIMGYCKDSLSGIGGKIRPGIVHRLDKDTSGIMIIAKNDASHLFLSNELKEHRVKKTYLALVRGEVKENEATIDMPIARSPHDRVKMAVQKRGKQAITHFKVCKRFSGYTLLEVCIETGRTHQIRVHLAQIGYPVVGDYVYSNGKNPFDVKGQMLHAYQLVFTHPKTKETMVLQAEIPLYFKQVLEKLEKEKRNS